MKKRALAFMAVGTLVGVGAAHASAPIPESQTASEPSSPAPQWREKAKPSPLSAQEEHSAAGALLARRYNPAMAFSHDDIWPVPLRYAWHDGSGLIARVLDPAGQVVRQFVARTHQQLVDNQWGDLPTETAEGHRIEYFVDAPGDDREDSQITLWRKRWRSIMKVHAADYHPTQYAHLFWFNRARGLLAIQYWFFYPYNEWINHHEGDWEHITVILHGPTALAQPDDFAPVGYQFFFHEYVTEPTQTVRTQGRDPAEDHVLIYVGGKSHFLNWKGVQSGGSYPLPAQFEAAGGGVAGWRPADDLRTPTRFIRPEDFDVVLLPEPERLDVGLYPELSWLRLPFFAGQQQMHNNPMAFNGIAFGAPPRQPAQQHTWNNHWTPPAWQGTPKYNRQAIAMPKSWRPLLSPLGRPETPTLSARRPKPKRRSRR